MSPKFFLLLLLLLLLFLLLFILLRFFSSWQTANFVSSSFCSVYYSHVQPIPSPTDITSQLSLFATKDLWKTKADPPHFKS